VDLIEAVNWVELIKVVDLAFAFQRTFEPLTNPAPLTVRVKPAPPALTAVGNKVLMNGFTVRLRAADVPPPGAGLKTVIAGVPALTISAAVIEAVNWVLLTKVVVRLLPLKRTTEPAKKFVPLTVNVKLVPPAKTLAGDSVVVVGTGTVVTEKLTGLDVPPAGVGLRTVTGNVPTAAMSVARIGAVN
jgi:hypothetical protein